MYIHEIHIENIRGFDEVDLDRGGGKYSYASEERRTRVAQLEAR